MNKPYGYVYKIVCKVNGKLYIGQTIRSISERWRSHVGDSQKRRNKDKLAISRAISKYGAENFEISIVCTSNNQDELNNREKLAIRIYRSIDYGYNIHEGGLNQRLSAETKAKISVANKGKKKPSGFGEKIRQARLGTKQPISVKIKCSTSQLGDKSAWFRRKHTEESKAKIGNIHKGKVVTEQQKEKQRLVMSGRKASEETKKKMSISRGLQGRNQRSIKCIESGITYSSAKEAASKLQISLNSLYHYLRGKLKTAQGFTFE